MSSAPKWALTVLILATCLLNVAWGLKVLVYSPVFGASHSNFMGRLADTLTDAGHDVTVLAPVLDFSRLQHIGVKLGDKVIVLKPSTTDPVNSTSSADLWTENLDNTALVKLFALFGRKTAKVCDNVFSRHQLIEQLDDEGFDVGIVEPIAICGMALFWRLGIKSTIYASSTTFYDLLPEMIGEPLDSSYIPGLMSTYNDNMTMHERIMNFRVHKLMMAISARNFEIEMEAIERHLGLEVPYWKDLVASGTFYFTNANPFIDFPRPILARTVLIGGITVDVDKIRSQKLDEEWDDVLSRRPKAVLVSFGTMASSSEMPIKYRNGLLKVFKSMPEVTFIWKYEDDNLKWASGAENVVFSRWVPQTALLADKRLSAFVTHGGLGSATELAYLGKPSITVPIFADQQRNGLMLERHGVTIVVDKFRLDEPDVVRNALVEVLQNPEYTKNAVRLAEILAAQPLKPKELVVKYTEFAAKFGELPSLDSQATKLNVFQFYYIDVILIGSAFSTIVAWILYVCMTRIRIVVDRTHAGIEEKRLERKSRRWRFLLVMLAAFCIGYFAEVDIRFHGGPWAQED